MSRDLFHLPESTVVNRVVPKNAFDSYTNTKQKNTFTKLISKITWRNKLSSQTINLSGDKILEIQIFDIELKIKSGIEDLLVIMNKAIPYPIIFIVRSNDELFVSTAAKHTNPQDEDSMVIDYIFQSMWFSMENISFHLELKNDLDWIFKNFCEQFQQASAKKNTKNISDLVALTKETNKVKRKIKQVESAMSKELQFNKKVVLNQELRALKKRLKKLS